MPVPTGATFLGVAREAVRGTFVAATDFIPIDASGADSPNDIPHIVEDTNARGSAVESYDQFATQIWAEPSYSNCNAYADVLGWWLKCLLGDEASSGTGGTGTTLAALSAVGATSVSVTADPAAATAITIDTGTAAELRAITSHSGAGPYTVNFALPLERAHANGATVTIGPGLPFVHNLAVLNSGNFQPPSLSLTDYNGDATKGIPGCLVVSLVLKWTATGLLTYDVKVTGFQSATQTKPSQAFSAERAKQGYLSAITLGGVGTSTLNDGELTIARQVDVIPTANGTQTPYAIWGNTVSVKGKANLVYESALFASEYAKLTGSTPTSLVFDWLTGATTTTREIKAQLSNVLYSSVKPTRGKSYLEVPIEFDGKGNVTDVGASGGFSPVLFTLKNARNQAY